MNEDEADQDIETPRWENARPRSLEYYNQVFPFTFLMCFSKIPCGQTIAICSSFPTSLLKAAWHKRIRMQGPEALNAQTAILNWGPNILSLNIPELSLIHRYLYLIVDFQFIDTREVDQTSKGGDVYIVSQVLLQYCFALELTSRDFPLI